MMKAKILKDIQCFKLPTGDFGPFESGEEVELSPWCLRALSRSGNIETQIILPSQLRRKIISEESSEDLSDLPEDFYSQIRESVLRLREEGKQDEAEKLKSLALTFAEVRLPKLLKMIFDPESAPSKVFEEKFLLNRMSVSLKYWFENLRRFIDGEEAKSHGERSV